MIKPEAIPQFTGNLGQLEKDYGSLKTDAGHIRSTGSDVHTQFQGLSAYYQAPEAEKLFASTKPVQDRADGFADDLEKVSTALSDYATEVRPLAAKLEQLKTDATKFVNANKDDDEWEYDEDKVDEHNQLRDDVTTTVAAFWAAERTCHNKITALFGGTQMVAGDGSDRKDQYGFNADDLKNAKLPWGDPVEEKHHAWEVGHWVKSFVWDGLIVDGIWGTIKGLGTLVGFGGWDAMGQAWKGLAQLATGLAITSIPGAGALFWTLPDDKLPSWLRDSRTAMKETGKALVAWDEWGKNPGRAAGAVTFNVLTTVFTGGAGAGVSGAGKAGAVAKVLSVAGKAGKVIDPMTYIAKGAGAGLSKIGDIAKGLKGIENIEIPKLPDDAIVLPEGALKLPDGAVHLPEGAAIPDGAVKLPDGNFKLPDDVPVLPEGATKLPTAPGAPARYFDNEYNLLDENGNVLQKVDDARVERSPDINPDTGADTPHIGTPDREPALVGAGAHTADTTAHVGANAGDHVIRIGDSLDNNLGDIGRTGDNLPGNNIGDNLPGGNAGNHLPGGGVGDHMPTGHAGDNMPSNSLDHAAPGSRVGDHVPGPRTETPGTGPGVGHDVPGGSNAHNGLPHTGDHGPIGPGSLDDLGHTADDAGHGADDAGHVADDGATPANHADEGTGNGGHNGERELTPAERKQIQDEHIRKANDPDRTWFEKYYDSRGHRLDKSTKESGVELPILAKDSNGNWISKYDLPHGPSEIRFDETPLKRESASPGALAHLDDVAKSRKVSMDLTHAEKTFEKNPSAAAQEALDQAQEAYAKQLGETPNNSSISERLGEDAAAYHVVPEKFPDAQHVPLPKTPNGANMFDQLYKRGDGSYLIVEAKAPSARLDWRQGGGAADGMMVKQGTKEYVQTIIAEMQSRSTQSVTDSAGRTVTNGQLALELMKALDSQKLEYVLVKANDSTGTYAGAMLEHFKIN
ncbi:hypothetical protein OIE61_22525 [Streptomyces sp. NBC_01762]|uniref:hypothetical protein n=1 Tax=unclassified Streptomyces TaxID=2593676 RepID=UPI002DDA4F49|nr:MULTISPECIES: hypothetical protein [unclassified Streptomyces]WSC46499.1 hypothetical protein OIE61_22525 [Streptomyces sp. NBC_01762]WSD26151.1 hypothetical protein OHA26_23215 [Streptomyces sp. NBC_01751]